MTPAAASDLRPSPLTKIVQVMISLGLLAGLGYATLRGLAFEDMIVPAAAMGFLVYLIVLADSLLGLAILIACIGFSPEFSIGGVNNFRLEDLVVPALLLAWFIRTGKDRIPLAPAHIWAPAVLSMICMVCATVGGSYFGTSQLTLAFLIMGKYTEYLMIYLLVINTVKTEGELRALAIFSILVALTSSHLSLSSTYAESASTVEGRVRGPLGETSNIYGGYLMLHFLLALGLYLHSTTGAGRLLAGSALVLLSISILFTYSRTTYVAIAGAILVFGFFKHRRLLLILVLMALVVPFTAPQSVMERMATVAGVASGPSPGSWTARLEAWEWAYRRMAPGDYFLGQGIGSVRFGDVDSEYVRIIADTGLLGLALFGWILFRLGRLANRTYNRIPGPSFERGYMAGYLMAFVAMMIHSVAATTFSAIRTEEAFMVLSGFMTVIANRSAEPGPEHLERPTVLLRDVPVLEPLRR
jgi:hypothetical protein